MHIGFVVGAVAAVSGAWYFQKKYKDLYIRWVVADAKAQRLEETELALREKAEGLTQLQMKHTATQERLAYLTEAQENLSNSFKNLSFEALEKNNRSFLELAKATLDKYQEGAKVFLRLIQR